MIASAADTWLATKCMSTLCLSCVCLVSSVLSTLCLTCVCFCGKFWLYLPSCESTSNKQVFLTRLPHIVVVLSTQYPYKPETENVAKSSKLNPTVYAPFLCTSPAYQPLLAARLINQNPRLQTLGIVHEDKAGVCGDCN